MQVETTVTTRTFGLILTYPGITSREINATLKETCDINCGNAVNAALQVLKKSGAIIAVQGTKHQFHNSITGRLSTSPTAMVKSTIPTKKTISGIIYSRSMILKSLANPQLYATVCSVPLCPHVPSLGDGHLAL